MNASPYLTKGLAIAAAVGLAGCAILWFRGQTLAERNGKLESVIADDERTIATLRAQHIAASAVAEALRDERDKDRAVARC